MSYTEELAKRLIKTFETQKGALPPGMSVTIGFEDENELHGTEICNNAGGITKKPVIKTIDK